MHRVYLGVGYLDFEYEKRRPGEVGDAPGISGHVQRAVAESRALTHVTLEVETIEDEVEHFHDCRPDFPTLEPGVEIFG